MSGGPAFRYFGHGFLKIEDNLGNFPLVVETLNENITLSILEALRHMKILESSAIEVKFKYESILVITSTT